MKKLLQDIRHAQQVSGVHYMSSDIVELVKNLVEALNFYFEEAGEHNDHQKEP